MSLFRILALLSAILAGAIPLRALARDSSKEGTFTEAEAVRLLRTKSFRWEQVSAAIQEAEGKFDQAHSAQIPHVSFGLREFAGKINLQQYGFTDPGNLTVFAFGITSIQAFYNLWDPAADSRTFAAELNLESVKFATDSNHNDLTFYTLVLYTQLQKWESMARHRRANVETIEKLKVLAKRKVKSELGIKLDIKRAEARLAMAQIKLLEAESNRFKARRDLASLLGISKIDKPANPIEIEIAPHLRSLDSIDTQKIAAERPDYLAASKLADAAEGIVRMEERERWPKVLIGGEIGLAGVEIFDGASRGPTGTAGISVSFPLYTGGYISGKLGEARSNSLRAQLQKDQVSLDAQHQLETSFYQYHITQEVLKTAGVGLSTAEQELKLAQSRFNYGVSGNFEVITAQMNLAQIEDELTEAWYAHHQAVYQILKVTNKLQDYVGKLGH